MNHLKTLETVGTEYYDCIVHTATEEREPRCVYCIHLITVNEAESISIKIQNSLENIIYQLGEFSRGRRKHCRFAKGMNNIDFLKSDETDKISIVLTTKENDKKTYLLDSVHDIEVLLAEFEEMQ